MSEGLKRVIGMSAKKYQEDAEAQQRRASTGSKAAVSVQPAPSPDQERRPAVAVTARVVPASGGARNSNPGTDSPGGWIV